MQLLGLMGPQGCAEGPKVGVRCSLYALVRLVQPSQGELQQGTGTLEGWGWHTGRCSDRWSECKR